MIQKDYIQRMTQQIAQIMAKLMGLNIDESLEIIDQAYTEWLTIDRKFLDQLSKNQLLDVLVKEKKLNINHLEYIAELLAIEGELFFKNKQLPKSRDTLQKSLILFQHVDLAQQLFSFDRQNKLKRIQHLLQQIEKQS